MKTVKFAKQSRHVNRLWVNQTKSTKLAIKQYCNEMIKKVKKDKSKSEVYINRMISIYKADKYKLFNS